MTKSCRWKPVFSKVDGFTEMFNNAPDHSAGTNVYLANGFSVADA
jgi:hypothetical protein